MRVVLALATIGVAAPVSAQTTWGVSNEITGQSAQVTTAGVTNTVYFDAGGNARVVTPGGQTVPATWTASAGKFCLLTGAATECWTSQAPIQAQKLTALSSSCGGLSEWVFNGVNAAPVPPPPPVSDVMGERG